MTSAEFGPGFDDAIAGAFDDVHADDFADAARLSAKLSPLAATFDDAGFAGFDLDDFVDRCVRLTETSFAGTLSRPAPSAVLACPNRDVTVPIQPGESLLAYLDRLHEELVRHQARAAFVVKATQVGWRTAPPPSAGRAGAPTVYFYCESCSGRVVHGFWRVLGVGREAQLTECYKLRSDQPNDLMHRIISGPR